MGGCITISIVSIIPTLSSCFLGIYQEMCVLFLVYGILLEQIPIILANCILIAQNLILLYYKINYSQPILIN